MFVKEFVRSKSVSTVSTDSDVTDIISLNSEIHETDSSVKELEARNSFETILSDEYPTELRSSDSQYQHDASLLKIWETFSLAILLLYFLEATEFSSTKYFSIGTDFMFLVDIIIRYYYSDLQYSNLPWTIWSRRNVWIVVDIVLSLPYGLLTLWWENLPMFKLLQLKNSHKPILTFLRRKSFRKEWFRNLKEHLIFRKTIREYWQLLTLQTPRFTLTGPIRKVGRAIVALFRFNKKFKDISYFLQCGRQVSWVVLTVRSVCALLIRVTPRASSQAFETT